MSPILSHHIQDTFRALLVRNYRVYISGQVIATIGFWLQMTATSWLVLELTGDSGTALGTAMALQFGPFLALSLFGGRLADRFDKRKVLMIGAIFNVCFAGTLAVVVLAGQAELWHVYLFMLCFGTVAAIEGPSRISFAAELVDRETLPNAIALNSATFNMGRIIGPAIAGILIALTDTGVVLALNAVAFMAPVVVMVILLRSRLHVAPRTRAERKENSGVIDSLRYLRRKPDIVLVLVLMLFVGGFAFNFPVTLSLMAKTEFNTGADAFGLLVTALSIGALVGALVSGKRHKRPGIYTLIVACVALGAGTTIVGFAPTFTIAMVLLLPTGFAMVYLAQSANQRVQMGVSDRYRGRVMSLYMLVFIGSTPLCAPIVGWVSEVYGAPAGLWLGGIVTLLAAAGAYVAKVVRSSAMEGDEPTDDSTAGATPQDLEPTDDSAAPSPAQAEVGLHAAEDAVIHQRGPGSDSELATEDDHQPEKTPV